MDGPEQLEDDARPARRGTWVVVAVVVAVVAALGAVRFSGVLPDPAPTPPTTPATSPSVARLEGWPEGIGGGTLYVLDRDGVAAVDVSSGRVERSPLRIDPTLATLTGGGAGVLVWFPAGTGTPRLVSVGSAVTADVGPVLARARQVLPGPGEGVWATDSAAVGSGADRWRLLAVDDTVVATARLTAPVQSDGAGGLFVRGDDRRVVHVVQGEPTTSWRGEVGAVGLQGWEELRCTGRRCTAVLHDRASGAETPLPEITPGDLGIPALSLGSRFVASFQPDPAAGSDRTVVRVAVPGAARALRSFPAAEDGRALVWLSDRWLAASGESGLVLYDAVDDRLVSLDAALRAPTQLVLRAV